MLLFFNENRLSVIPRIALLTSPRQIGRYQIKVGAGISPFEPPSSVAAGEVIISHPTRSAYKLKHQITVLNRTNQAPRSITRNKPFSA